MNARANTPKWSRRRFLQRGGGLVLASSALGSGLVPESIHRLPHAWAATPVTLDLTDVRPGNVFAGDEPMRLREVLRDPSGRPSTYKVELVGRDADGIIVSRHTQTLRVASAEPVKYVAPVGADAYGAYTADATLRASDGTTVATTTTALARVPQPPDRLQPDSPWGIGGGGSFIGIRFDETTIATRLQLVAEAGVAFSREEIFWDTIEPSEGEWHWERFDPAVIAARNKKVLFLALLDYWASWSLPDGYQGQSHPTPWAEAIDNFANYCFQVVSRYKPGGTLARVLGWDDDYGIRHWEVWNEPPTFWFGTAEEFGRLVRAASAAIRRADPDAFVVVSNGGESFDQQVVDVAGIGSYDAMAIHLYPGPAGPEEGKFVEQIHQARTFLDRNDGRQVRLWVTETGWNVHGGVSPWEQAAYIVRANVEAVAAGVERVLDFTLQYDGEGWGILDDALHPRVAYAAYAALTDRLRDHRPSVGVPMGSAVRAYVFGAEQGATAVVWSTAENGSLNLHAGAHQIQPHDVMGNRLDTGRGPVEVPLTGRPVFLVAPGLSPERLARIVKAGSVHGLTPLDIGIDNLADLPVNLPDLTVTITNRVNVDQHGTATLTLPDGWSVAEPELPYGPLAPGASTVLRYRLQQAPTNPDNTYPVRISATTPAAPGVVTAQTTLFVTAVIRGTPPIDGTLDGFRTAAPVHVQRPDQVVGIPNWTPAGCSATAWAMWDEDNFYFAVSVTDDVFHQPYTGGDIWNGDSVQLMFDPDNVKQGMPPGAQEYGLALTSQGEQVHRFNGGSSDVPGARLVCRRGENSGIVYTFALPMTELGIEPGVGTRIGMDFLVNDNDGSGRSGWIYWTPGIGNAWDSSLFSTWTFVGERL
ncbi:sugar-binding protein [Actinopolymorpha singaporensis]